MATKTDIVERLRDRYRREPRRVLLDEAATELERLRAENAMLRADNDALRAGLAGYQSWHHGRYETS